LYFYTTMQTKVVKLDAENIDSDKIKEAASVIDAGGLVAFPTETVYGIACQAQTNSLSKLNNIKGRDPAKFYTLHIGQRDDVKKYVPTIELKAKKLINNAWPGPLTIVFELDQKDIDKQRRKLEKRYFKNLYQNNSIGIRCPDNPIAINLLQTTQNPVVAPSANITGQSPAVDAKQVLTQLSDQIDLLLDGGPCKYKTSSTVVKIGKMKIEILRPGAYSREELEKKAAIQFLFVCTGNTCRSPMAEGIFRKYLAEKLECNVDQLNKKGYKVCSAGVMGLSGAPASAEAMVACAAMGVDLRAHRNQGLSIELLEDSDFIFAMEQIHKDRIIALNPKAASKCFLLASGKGISDPIGHPQEFFNSCAETIETAVKQRISELVI
jgi:L-threonylcarbamoyladenylate synthase